MPTAVPSLCPRSNTARPVMILRSIICTAPALPSIGRTLRIPRIHKHGAGGMCIREPGA